MPIIFGPWLKPNSQRFLKNSLIQYPRRKRYDLNFSNELSPKRSAGNKISDLRAYLEFGWTFS